MGGAPYKERSKHSFRVFGYERVPYSDYMFTNLSICRCVNPSFKNLLYLAVKLLTYNGVAVKSETSYLIVHEK